MNDSQIVKNMISFIEKAEKNFQATKLGNSNSTKLKSKVVDQILNELEREMKDAGQEH